MKKRNQVIAGALLGLLALWLVFRVTDWGEVWVSMREIRPGWLAATILLVFVSFFARVQRWSYIVRTAGPVRFRHMFSATQIGFLANTVLPMRLGELVRALVLSRLAGLPVSKSMAMVVLDRVTDLIGLLCVMAVSILTYMPKEAVFIPKDVVGVDVHIAPSAIWWSEMGLLVLLLVSVAALTLLIARRDFVLWLNSMLVARLSRGLAGRLDRAIREFSQGLQALRSPSAMAKAIAFSLITWGCLVAMLDLYLRAFGVRGPWYTAFVIQVLLAAVVTLPSTPGATGLFHLAVVAGLMMLVPDASPNTAKAVAIVAHLISVLTIIVSGVVCLYIEGMGLGELRREISEAESDPSEETGGVAAAVPPEDQRPN